jgi:hypothetical protein
VSACRHHVPIKAPDGQPPAPFSGLGVSSSCHSVSSMTLCSSHLDTSLTLTFASTNQGSEATPAPLAHGRTTRLPPRPPRQRRRRRNNHNRVTGSAPRPVGAPGPADDTDSLARDLTSFSLMPRASTSTHVAPAPTRLAPPPIAWGRQLHRLSHLRVCGIDFTDSYSFGSFGRRQLPLLRARRC